MRFFSTIKCRKNTPKLPIETDAWLTASLLQEYQSFTDLMFSKDKTITAIDWHPTQRGIVAVSVGEKLSFDNRLDHANQIIMTPSLILIWSFADPIHPQVRATNELMQEGLTGQKSHYPQANHHAIPGMLSTSKNVLLPGHNHLLTTSTDDPTL